jgi:hypothetical protein
MIEVPEMDDEPSPEERERQVEIARKLMAQLPIGVLCADVLAALVRVVAVSLVRATEEGVSPEQLAQAFHEDVLATIVELKQNEKLQ